MEATGDVVDEEGVLVIKRINVHYRLRLAEDQRDLAERVHGFHARFCPVARSLEGGIEVNTELELA